MKDKYLEKIDKMHQGSKGKQIATYFAEREGKAITAIEIEQKFNVDRTQVRNVISTLRASGWIINNRAENGLSAQWCLAGVGNRKGGAKPDVARPKLHPLIESVFC